MKVYILAVRLLYHFLGVKRVANMRIFVMGFSFRSWKYGFRKGFVVFEDHGIL